MNKFSQRILYIDGLRGVAALGVAWFHLYTEINKEFNVDTIGNVLNLIAVWGRFGVPLFFTISGFVIGQSLQKSYNIDSLKEVGAYFVRRSIRLDPTYWFALIISVLIGVFLASSAYGHHVPELNSLKEILINGLYLQKIMGATELLAVAWTLCLELQLYIAFCFLLLVANQVKKYKSEISKEKIEFVIITLAAFFSILWPLNVMQQGEVWFFTYFYMFLTGVLLYNGIIEHRYWIILGLIDFLLLFVVLQTKSSIICATLISHFIILSAHFVPVYRKILESKLLLFFGKLSYTLYLFHVPIGFLSAHYMLQYKMLHFIGSRLEHFIVTVLSLLCTCLVSLFVHNVVERRSIYLSKKIRIKRLEQKVTIQVEHKLECVGS